MIALRTSVAVAISLLVAPAMAENPLNAPFDAWANCVYDHAELFALQSCEAPLAIGEASVASCGSQLIDYKSAVQRHVAFEGAGPKDASEFVREMETQLRASTSVYVMKARLAKKKTC